MLQLLQLLRRSQKTTPADGPPASIRRPTTARRLRPIAALIAIAITGVWMSSTTVAQSGGGGGGGGGTAPVSSVKIGSAALVAPSTADSFYGSATTSTNSTVVGGQTAINAPNAEYLEFARALDNDPDQIFAFVRNSVDTTFTYGVGKGGLGALVDRSGNAFDQAQLLVGLFRAAGITAGYRAGTMQLTGAQFTDWTGITSASAACRLLANGGIPATVNGSTITNCDYGSAVVSTVTLGHIWVAATIGGSSYQFDPSYKPYTVKAGVNLATASELSAGQAFISASSGVQSGTAGASGTVPFVRSINATNLNSQIGARAAALRTFTEANLPDGALSDLIGGREIDPFVIPAGGLRQTTLPHPTVQQRIWSGDIPNQYRAAVRVSFTKVESDGTVPVIIDHLFYVDDVYARKLVFMTTFNAGGTLHTGALKVLNEFGQGPTIASFSRSGPGQNARLSKGDLTLTVNAPYAAAAAGGATAGAYMDAVVVKSVDFVIPLTIVTGWGETGSGLVSKWGSRNDAYLPKPKFPGGCETCGGMPGTQGDGRRELIAATWLTQSSRAAGLHAQIARSTYQHHYSVGVVSADTWVGAVDLWPPPSPTRNYNYQVDDSMDRVDIDTGFSLTSWDNDTQRRRAAIQAISTTLATLEGSVVGQVADLPDVNSTATRFEWGNAPPAGEDESQGAGARRFYRFDASNSGDALALAKVEGMTTTTNSDHHGGSLVSIGSNEVGARRSRLAQAVGDYAAAGFRVTASEDAFLGPGQRGGAFVRHDIYSQQGTGSFYYTHRYSMQRGGALVATRTDASGEPLEIAHVTVGPYRNAKGGGGAQPSHEAQYDPAKFADLLKDSFEDRSSAAGVDLSSGVVSYTSPASLTVGQGTFPYSLTAQIAWRGGQPEQFSGSVQSNIAPRGAWATNWNTALSISSSGNEIMGERDVRAALGTVAAFLVMQDVYASSAPSEGDQARRDVVGVLTGAWWAKQITGNVATVTIGTGSTQFVRRPDNQWFVPGAGGAATLTQTGTRTPFTETPGCTNSDMTYVTSRGWNYAGMSFQVRSSSGDVQTFQNWRDHTFDCRLVRGFRMTNWSFPSGANVDLIYALQGELQELTEVRNNLGLKITFTNSGRSGFQDGNAPSRAVLTNGDGFTDATTHTDALQQTHRFTVSTAGSGWQNRFRLTEVYTPLRPTTPSLTYVYDSLGRVQEARDALAVVGQRPAHQFFIAERFRGRRQDPVGGKYTVHYDDQNQPIRHTDEEGRVSLASFDGRGRVKTRTSAWGDVTRFEYDDRDNVIELRRLSREGCGTDVVWCQSSTTTATYHPTWNKPLTITLPATYLDGQAASTWTFAYDTQGRLETQTSPVVYNGLTGGNVPAIWRTWYDAYGRVTQTRDPTGIEASMTYGGYGQPAWCMTRQTASTQSGGFNQISAFTCNTAGDVTTATDPRGHVTTTTWDALRRKTAEIGPAGTNIQTQWTYDADGNTTEERRWDSTTSEWRTAITTYSLTGKPLTVTDPAGDVTRTCYDGLDRATVAVDPSGRATRTTYNLAGQPTLVERWFTASLTDATCALTNTRPAHLTTNRWRGMEYNSGGLQSAEIDGNNNRTTLDYDGLGRHAVTTYADGKYTQNIRNERDQVYVAIARSGDYQHAFYDAMGRAGTTWEHAAGAAWPLGRVTSTAYDLASRTVWTAVSTQTGTPFDEALQRDIRTYSYDAAGRVIYDRITPNNGTMGSNQLILGYGYDQANNRTTIKWPDAYQANYTFDAANRATRVEFGPVGNTAQYHADIAVDSLSRRTGLNRSNGVNTTYAYDNDSDLNQINHAWAPSAGQTPATFGFQRDPAGRITGLSINRPDLEWMPSLAYAQTYGVPTNLNQTTSRNGAALTWSDNGNLLTHGSASYEWTFGNRLIRVIKPGSTTEYAYDTQDRRTVVIEDGVMTRTLWSGADEVGEYDLAGVLKRRFIPDGSGSMDARLATVNPDDTIYWYHTDHQGSMIATSDGYGQPFALGNYSPHGEFGTGVGGVPLTAPPQGSPFGYTGRQWDAKAGLYQYRARYYSPELGVFLSMDPIGTKDDPNLYMYVGLDPVNQTDPTGMQSVYGEVHLRRRDIGPAAADRQNREQADRFMAGVRWIVNDIRNDPLGATIDGAMIVADVLTFPSGEAAVGIGIRRGLREASETAGEGIIYRRTNPTTGREYIGRANNERLYRQRQRSHDRNQRTQHDYEEVERAEPGRALREAEQRNIDAGGGPTNRSNPNGGLENRRNEIAPGRRRRDE